MQKLDSQREKSMEGTMNPVEFYMISGFFQVLCICFPSSLRGSYSAVRTRVSGKSFRLFSRIGAKYGFCLSSSVLWYKVR